MNKTNINGVKKYDVNKCDQFNSENPSSLFVRFSVDRGPSGLKKPFEVRPGRAIFSCLVGATDWQKKSIL